MRSYKVKEFLKSQIKTAVKIALKEDVGSGDITTCAVIKKDATASAFIIAKEDGVLAGIEVAKKVFQFLNPGILFKILKKDGQKIRKKDRVAYIKGKAHIILKGERTALNFLQHLSGIATKTFKLTRFLKGTKTRLLDTRKTIPGLRFLEKYAVKIGGGRNHRLGLFDGILIKDNHLKFCSIFEAVQKVKKKNPNLKIEVETKNLIQIKEALEAEADIIMLDNMSLAQIKKALKLIKNKAKVEVSGKITSARLKTLSKLGVDFISMGELTHSPRASDISLKIVKREASA